MKGNNMIQLNQATLIEAIQEYLDKRWSGPEQKVMAVTVTRVNNEYGSGTLGVDVAISEVEQKS